MRSQTLAALGGVFDFLEGQTQLPDPMLDLAPLKKALLGNEGRQFSRTLVEDLPVGGQPSQFFVSPGQLPESRPSSLSVEKATNIVVSGLPIFVSVIPDRIRLSDNLLQRDHFSSWSRPWFPLIRTLIFADVSLLALSTGLWVAAAFLGGIDARQRLTWMGWSLLAPAGAVFLAGLIITLSLLSRWIHGGLTAVQLESLGFAAGFRAAIADAVRLTIRRVGVSFLASGATAAGVSLAMPGASWSMLKERSASP
jgi:hypothetical protein